MSTQELETCFREQPLRPLSPGRFRGHHLSRLDTPGAKRPLYHVGQKLLFEWAPWGIDFSECAWFFFTSRAMTLGHFVPRTGPSRWRDTQAIGMHYHLSRLPGVIRNVLYDEVKPLSDELMLGLGGVNASRDQGDHFFFALERMPC